MSIIDLLINDLQVEDLDVTQILELTSRLIDIAEEKLDGGSNNEEE